jgi:hypothetical protein
VLGSFLRRRRTPLIICVIVIAYAAVFLAWTRGSNGNDDANLPKGAGALPTDAGLFGLTPPASSPATTGSGAASSPGGPVKSLNLPDLPQSSNINGAAAPRHSVVITITSDRAILRAGYAVKGAKPDRHSATNVQSPLRVVTVGRGYGAMAVVGAQSSPGAKSLTCTIAVDGLVRSSRTVHGGWTVAICLG